MPLLALAAYRITLVELAVATLDTYVGLSAGRRVLSGEIRRGSGTTLTAALYVADLRGFTTVTDTAGVDVMGDGRVVPFRCGIVRRELEPKGSQTPYDAVRKALR